MATRIWDKVASAPFFRLWSLLKVLIKMKAMITISARRTTSARVMAPMTVFEACKFKYLARGSIPSQDKTEGYLSASTSSRIILMWAKPS